MSEYTNEKRTYVAGYVTAYGAAKRGGYTGTYDEFCADMAHLAGMTAQATTLDAGEPATASYDDGVLSLGIPKGDKGEKGDDGGLSAEAIANEYDPSESYAIGDYCIYDGALYKCVVGIATPEEWTAAHWTAISMTEEVSDLKTATLIPSTASGSVASFPDGADLPIRGLKVGIEPVQDLHGYDSPWPAGGGKNKLSIDPSIVTKTQDGLTYTVNRNSAGDVISIVVNGTATARSYFSLGRYNVSGGTILNGCPSGGGVSAYGLAIDGTTVSDYGSGSAIESDLTNAWILIVIANGRVCSNLTFKPMIRLASVSDATFAPYSNECPITGWTGVNVWRTGKNLIDVADETNVQTTHASVSLNSIVADVKWKPNTQYTLTVYSQALEETHTSKVWYARFMYADGSLDGYGISVINSNNNSTGQTMTRYTITSQASKTVVGIKFSQGTGYYIAYKDVQLEEGSTATAYEPYTATTLPISWQSEVGTVYGGSLDVTSGVLVVDRAVHVFDGTDNVGLANWKPTTGTSAWLYTPSVTPNSINAYMTASNLDDVICDTLKTVPYNTTSEKIETSTNPCISVIGNSDWGIVMRINDDTLTTKALINAYLEDNPITVVYKLAEPLTIQLTPSTLRTLYGQNNVWADTGDTTIDYYADTKLYIEKLTAPTEDDMVANSNIQSGKYFMVGNALYLSTAAIAANETIRPGTNCTRVSLADALNSLNA